MGIPAEIRAVGRPKNTVVMAYGKNKDLYAVKQRIGSYTARPTTSARWTPAQGSIVTLIGKVLLNQTINRSIDESKNETMPQYNRKSKNRKYNNSITPMTKSIEQSTNRRIEKFSNPPTL